MALAASCTRLPPDPQKAQSFAAAFVAAMDDVVELELIDLLSVEPPEALANPLEQRLEFLLVVCSYEVARCTTLRLRGGSISVAGRVGHIETMCVA